MDAKWDVLFFSEADYHSVWNFDVDVTPHRTERYWPGEGSRALRFIVHSRLDNLRRRITWGGRAGCLELSSGFGRGRHRDSLTTLGVHGPHCDGEFPDFFSDISWLLAGRPQKSKTIAVGDWNIDELPNFSGDPFRDVSERSNHHALRRAFRDSWADTHHLSLSLADQVFDSPGGNWDELCISCPISHIPSDLQLGRPGILDYSLGNFGLVQESHSFWQPRVSDHAINKYVVKFRHEFPIFAKSRWKCTDPDACIEFIKTHMPTIPFRGSQSALIEFLHTVKQRFEETSSCRIRRQQRMPFSLRTLYSRAARCSCTVTRKQLLDDAWIARKAWLHDLFVKSRNRSIDQGRNVAKPKRLFKLRSIVAVDSHGASQTVASDNVSIATTSAKCFGDRWGASDMRSRELLLDFIHGAEGHSPNLEVADFAISFTKLRRWDSLDTDGICVRLLWSAFQANPLRFTSWMQQCLAHRQSMEALVAKCIAFGKKSQDSTAKDLRAIVPMSSILRLLDRVLAEVLGRSLPGLLPAIPGFFVGAQKYTQVQDISHACSLFIERALDNFSNGAWAQADIQTYFDSLPVLKILQWLRKRGCDFALLAAIARHQLFSSVCVYAGACCSCTANRCRGGLTGSQLALLLSKVPVESSFAELNDAMEVHSFKTDAFVLKACVYIDNLYTVGHSASAATAQMEQLLTFLRNKWGLSAKPGSKCVLPAEGSDVTELNGDGWTVEKTSIVLGHHIQGNGGIDISWKHLTAKMWKAFYANVKAPSWRKLGMARRLKLVDRSVKGIAEFFVSAMPPQHHYGCDLDRIQRKMVAAAMGNSRLRTESWEEFCRRSAKQASSWVEQHSRWWSRQWLQKAIDWNSHVERDWQIQKCFWQSECSAESLKTKWSWCPLLLHWHGDEWLRNRRIFQNRSGRSHCTHTRTRRVRGKVHTRWHDGIQYASRMLS